MSLFTLVEFLTAELVMGEPAETTELNEEIDVGQDGDDVVQEDEGLDLEGFAVPHELRAEELDDVDITRTENEGWHRR